jgi:plasmid replication initiation protein
MQKQQTNLVYLDNKLAQASHNLSLSEQRLLFLALSKTNQGYQRSPTELEKAKHLLGAIDLEAKDLRVAGEDFDSTTKFTISVFDYAQVCGIRSVDAREELQLACDTLFKRQVTLKEEDGSYNKFHWVQGVRYDAKTDSISFHWTIDIIPYIKDLQTYFTKLKLGKLLQLTSTYSWKLYTILCSKKGENKYKTFQKIPVEDLMFMLDVPESCKEFKHFNNLILKKVAKEFVTKLGMEKFEVSFMKEGRCVKEVCFAGFSIADDAKKGVIKDV